MNNLHSNLFTYSLNSKPWDELSPHEIRSARRAAVQLAYQLDLNNQWFMNDRLLRAFNSQNNIPEREKVFIEIIIEHLISGLNAVDGRIEAHSTHWKMSRISKVDLAILRVCVTELGLRPDIPLGILVADAAEMGKLFGNSHSSSFVHGVLDAIAKNIVSN